MRIKLRSRRVLQIALAIGAGLLVWGLFWPGQGRLVTLPDGAQLILARVDFGKTSAFYYGSGWRAALGRWLGHQRGPFMKIGLWQMQGPNLVSTVHGSNVVTCWFLLKPPPGSIAWFTETTLEVTCRDDRGNEQEGKSYYDFLRTTDVTSGPAGFEPFPFIVSPEPSSARLELIVSYQKKNGSRTNVARFTLRNPGR